MENTEKYKETVNRFLDEIRTVTHAMIDDKYVSDSPVKLVREALDYLDTRYNELREKEKTDGPKA